MAIRAGRSALHLFALAFLLILAACPCLQGNAARDTAPSPSPSLSSSPPPAARPRILSVRTSLENATAAALDLCDFSLFAAGERRRSCGVGLYRSGLGFWGRVCVDYLI
jgi:hypothetical protein